MSSRSARPEVLRVLIGCEKSGRVREAFRACGHEAFSCDLLPAEDASAFHIIGDVLEVAAGSRWDIGIFHPPCTFLCSSGLHWNRRRPGRSAKTDEAVAFVLKLARLPIRRKAIENPRGCLSTRWRRPDQTVQPWQFGDDASKGTDLWLERLPPLRPTQFVEPRLVCCGAVLSEGLGKYSCPNCLGAKIARPRWANQTDSGQNRLAPSATRAADRARTYLGIARAMATQWGPAGGP